MCPTRNFLFQTIKVQKPKVNKFNGSFSTKFTSDFAFLKPIFCKPAYPGDLWRVQSNAFIRLMPMFAPVLHECNVYIHFFFVPYRTLWDNWETFITGGKSGTDAPAPPTIDPYTYSSISDTAFDTYFGTGSLWDFCNFPSLAHNNRPIASYPVSAFPFMAYQKIFNDYYRDENLTDEVAYSTDVNGIQSWTDARNLLETRFRAWEKDYFTSALPWPQRGSDVQLGTIDSAIVALKSSPSGGMKLQTAGGAVKRDVGLSFQGFDYSAGGGSIDVGSFVGNTDTQFGTTHSGIINTKDITNQDDTTALYIDPNGNYVINGTLFDINQLRNSMRLQEWLEKNARGGSRYVEQLLSHFGVVSDDARLQRAEYLGGGFQPIVMSEVTQTSGATDSSNVLGEYAGHGISAGTTTRWTKYFKEHGVVMGIMSVLPRTAYFQGIPRYWNFSDKLELAWPEFSNLGEQEIKNSELYYDPAAAVNVNEATFGYTPRYAELKMNIDEVHGLMRSNMLHWHLARNFALQPSLNVDFVTCNPANASRIFSVTKDENHLVCEVKHNVDMLRAFSKYGTPTF